MINSQLNDFLLGLGTFIARNVMVYSTFNVNFLKYEKQTNPCLYKINITTKSTSIQMLRGSLTKPRTSVHHMYARFSQLGDDLPSGSLRH